MSNAVTLWLDNDDTESEIIPLLKSRKIDFGVKFLEANGRRRDAILFTSLGTFEGEREIRRALEVLAASSR